LFVTDVPSEFRRVELFVSGTVPNRAILKTDEGIIEYDPVTGEPIEPKPKTEPTSTPLDETWEESLEPAPKAESPAGRKTPNPKIVTVIICPLTNFRATINCPRTEAKAFTSGKEPRDFCALHR
jgi:hypothetical protein